MGCISEETFKTESDKNKGYSLVEYDLYAKTGLSIRKNFTKNRYEIFEIKSGKVHYSYSNIHDIVRVANDIEGEENTFVKD